MRAQARGDARCAARSRAPPSMRPSALATRERRQPAARFGGRRAGDAGAVAGDVEARHRTCRPTRRRPVRSTPADRSTRARSRRRGEVDVGHHALVQQHVVDRQRMLLRRRRRSEPRARARRPRTASDVTYSTTRTLPAHRAHQLAALARNTATTGTPARARSACARAGRAASCRAARRSSRPARSNCDATSHSKGPQPASTVRPFGIDARGLEQDLRGAGRAARRATSSRERETAAPARRSPGSPRAFPRSSVWRACGGPAEMANANVPSSRRSIDHTVACGT